MTNYRRTLPAALLVFVAGCVDARTTEESGSAAQNPGITADLVDMDGVKRRLPQAEAGFLAELVSEEPDVDSTAHLALDPPYRVIVDEADFALEPDELILMHAGGTRRWNSPGVGARVLTAAGITKRKAQ